VRPKDFAKSVKEIVETEANQHRKERREKSSDVLPREVKRTLE
jgi:hypothetical protein